MSALYVLVSACCKGIVNITDHILIWLSIWPDNELCIKV